MVVQALLMEQTVQDLHSQFIADLVFHYQEPQAHRQAQVLRLILITLRQETLYSTHLMVQLTMLQCILVVEELYMPAIREQVLQHQMLTTVHHIVQEELQSNAACMLVQAVK